MKCPKCGAWNQAYLPKCVNCGAPLPHNTGEKEASWEESMHKKKPSLEVTQYDKDDTLDPVQPPLSEDFDPEALDKADLTDEIEELKKRREIGTERLSQMRRQAERMRRSIQQAEVVRPMPEADDMASAYAGDRAAIKNRQEHKQQEYTQSTPSVHDDMPYGYFGDPAGQPLTYDDSDPNAPIYYDGYTPESGDQGALTDDEYLPRRVQTRPAYPDYTQDYDREHRKKRSPMQVVLKIVLLLVCCCLMGVGGVLIARHFVLSHEMQIREDNETRIELTETVIDGHPAHTLTIYGRENATVYIKEMRSSYVIADGKVTISVPDYMWYDTESSTYATPVETDTMDVTITPSIRYSQEGDQYPLEPIHFTIDVPLSPIRLINPSTARAEVGVSIYEVRINVEKGSTVIIDGTNVSTLIRDETGNVSKNVQVLPVGDNTISISVKSKFCRENKMEITLFRAAQDIPLELDPTVLVEWNYEPISEEKYNSATPEERKEMHIPAINGTTLPGATITVDFPHRNLTVDPATGRFRFVPIFTELGNNEIPIRASYEGKKDSIITHTVYYMPNQDIYTRRAWDLNTQYNDLVNNISMRKGTIYLGIGTIERIISTSPQMAIMNIGTPELEKLVMLENSSKTTWEIGTKYRIYGDAYGLYDTMPRLTVRYTYLDE